MAYTTSLMNVPHFTFYPDDGEFPINVNYYNGSIELEQGNETVTFQTDRLEELFKAIKKNKAEAIEILSRRK